MKNGFANEQLFSQQTHSTFFITFYILHLFFRLLTTKTYVNISFPNAR